MIEELRFVQGAVARKDFTPALTHFHIKDGRIQGYNGLLALSCPIALDIDVTPQAAQLVKAIRGCNDTVALSMTSGKRLAVKSGRFKAFVDCFEGGFPEITPTGVRMELPEDFMEALKVLEPFVADDASRQWARGVLFRGSSAYATNNIVLVEYWMGSAFPKEMNIPREAIRELLRIGEAPIALLADETAVTFLYKNERWMRTQLYTTQWPDVSTILDQPTQLSPPTLTAKDVEELLPFVEDTGRVYFLEDTLTTSLADGVGARLEVPGVLSGPIFNAEMLIMTLQQASMVDFTRYPKPCLFTGPNLRGALIGMRA